MRYATPDAGTTAAASRQPPPAKIATAAQANATRMPRNQAGYRLGVSSMASRRW